MPFGSGKSTLCNRFGFLDIDKIGQKFENMRDILKLRRMLSCSLFADWTEHNIKWTTNIRKLL